MFYGVLLYKNHGVTTFKIKKAEISKINTLPITTLPPIECLPVVIVKSHACYCIFYYLMGNITKLIQHKALILKLKKDRIIIK
jgi:hypothetical protein